MKQRHQSVIVNLRITLNAVLLLCGLSILLISCSTTEPLSSPRYTSEVAAESAEPSLTLPDGWADVTSRSQLPQILLWSVNQDYSGSMVLREMQDPDSSLLTKFNTDPRFVANISLLSKFSGTTEGRRVTIAPSVLDAKLHLCGYVYSEKGLLRKVILYSKAGKLFELELLQEKPDVSFDKMSSDQLILCTNLISQ